MVPMRRLTRLRGSRCFSIFAISIPDLRRSTVYGIVILLLFPYRRKEKEE